MYIYFIGSPFPFSLQLICARNIVNEDCETPPDTYVKCYIKDGDRLRHEEDAGGAPRGGALLPPDH